MDAEEPIDTVDKIGTCSTRLLWIVLIHFGFSIAALMVSVLLMLYRS
jgi:hypothetical protein